MTTRQKKSGDEGLDRTELESMKRVFERLDRKNDGKIDGDEIAQQLELLGYKPKRRTDFGTSEVDDMIWEVDEDCDGKIDWDNFVHLYIRCRRDKTGNEPKRLFNLIEFMINDKDGGGTINEDEMMEVLFHRYGKDVMQRVTDELFHRDGDGDVEKDLTFMDFVEVVNSGITKEAAEGERAKDKKGLGASVHPAAASPPVAATASSIAAKPDKSSPAAAGGGGGGRVKLPRVAALVPNRTPRALLASARGTASPPSAR